MEVIFEVELYNINTKIATKIVSYNKCYFLSSNGVYKYYLIFGATIIFKL